MQVRIRLFAVARQLAGRPEVVVSVDGPATVSDVRRALGLAVPELAPVLPRLKMAVGNEYADDERSVGPDDEVAVIPPVSGGSEGAPGVSRS